MERRKELILLIKSDFEKCLKVLVAMGDETRQAIIVALIETFRGQGMRVGEITKLTHLSRSAVSHHLRILKDAQIVSMRREGTMTFYSLDMSSALSAQKVLIDHIEAAILKF